jgi:perosamine synthetase
VIRVVGLSREEVFYALREQGIGVNVHYIPVYYHPLYKQKFGIERGLCPIAETAYEQILTLPIFPKMSEEDIESVVSTLYKINNDSLAYKFNTQEI